MTISIGDLLSIYIRVGKSVRLANAVYLKTTITTIAAILLDDHRHPDN